MISEVSAFAPSSIDDEFQIARLTRAAFAAYWEETTEEPVPLLLIQAIFARPNRWVEALNHDPVVDVALWPRTVIDSLASAIFDERRLRNAYAEQLRRTTCPTCGEGDCTF